MCDFEKAKSAIKEPWISLFMDGRNEHGTHLLPVPPDGLCIGDKALNELLDSHNEDIEQLINDQ